MDINLFRKLLSELFKRPFMNPLVQSTARHLSRITITETPYTSLYALHPEIRYRVEAIMAEMNDLGMPVYIVSGFRTGAQQDKLYSQGRTTAGNIVTNAQALESSHNFGLAVDFMFKGYNYTSNQPPESHWQKLGEVVEANGMSWGGRWQSFPDRPHAEHSSFESERKSLIEFFKK